MAAFKRPFVYIFPIPYYCHIFLTLSYFPRKKNSISNVLGETQTSIGTIGQYNIKNKQKEPVSDFHAIQKGVS